MSRSFLFIGGCPRSGTTAMQEIIDAHDEAVVGRERYIHISDELTPDHFDTDHFLHPTRAETNNVQLSVSPNARRKLMSGTDLAVIGDKVPLYCLCMPRLANRFPESRFIVTVRSPITVADSFHARAIDEDDVSWPPKNDYRAAVEIWNRCMERTYEWASGPGADRTLVVLYELFFSGRQEGLDAVRQFLGLCVSESMEDAFRERTESWEERRERPLRHMSSEHRQEIRSKFDWALYRWAEMKWARSLEFAAKRAN